MSQLRFSAGATVTQISGYEGRIKIWRNIEIVRQCDINPIFIGVAEPGKQEPRLALIGNRKTQIGRIEYRHPFYPQYGVAGRAKNAAFFYHERFRLNPPIAVTRFAPGERVVGNGQIAIFIAFDFSGATAKFRSNEQKIHAL